MAGVMGSRTVARPDSLAPGSQMWQVSAFPHGGPLFAQTGCRIHDLSSCSRIPPRCDGDRKGIVAMNTPAIRSRDIDAFDRYGPWPVDTALDRAYGNGRVRSGWLHGVGQSAVLPHVRLCPRRRWWASPICCCCRGTAPSTDASGRGAERRDPLGAFRRVMQNGDTLWIHATYMPVTDEAGTLLGVVKLAHDITAEMLAQATGRTAEPAVRHRRGRPPEFSAGPQPWGRPATPSSSGC